MIYRSNTRPHIYTLIQVHTYLPPLALVPNQSASVPCHACSAPKLLAMRISYKTPTKLVFLSNASLAAVAAVAAANNSPHKAAAPPDSDTPAAAGAEAADTNASPAPPVSAAARHIGADTGPAAISCLAAVVAASASDIAAALAPGLGPSVFAAAPFLAAAEYVLVAPAAFASGIVAVPEPELQRREFAGVRLLVALPRCCDLPWRQLDRARVLPRVRRALAG